MNQFYKDRSLKKIILLPLDRIILNVFMVLSMVTMINLKNIFLMDYQISFKKFRNNNTLDFEINNIFDKLMNQCTEELSQL